MATNLQDVALLKSDGKPGVDKCYVSLSCRKDCNIFLQNIQKIPGKLFQNLFKCHPKEAQSFDLSVTVVLQLNGRYRNSIKGIYLFILMNLFIYPSSVKRWYEYCPMVLAPI